MGRERERRDRERERERETEREREREGVRRDNRFVCTQKLGECGVPSSIGERRQCVNKCLYTYICIHTWLA